MKIEDFKAEIKKKFEEIILEDREEATENFGSKMTYESSSITEVNVGDIVKVKGDKNYFGRVVYRDDTWLDLVDWWRGDWVEIRVNQIERLYKKKNKTNEEGRELNE